MTSPYYNQQTTTTFFAHLLESFITILHLNFCTEAMMRIQAFFENCRYIFIYLHTDRYTIIIFISFLKKVAHKHTKNDVDKIRPKFGQTAIIIVSRLHSTTKLFELSYITTKTFTKPRPICSRALFKTLNPIQPCSSFYFTRVLFSTRYNGGQYIYILHTLNILFFFQISIFIKLCVPFVFGLHTL